MGVVAKERSYTSLLDEFAFMAESFNSLDDTNLSEINVIFDMYQSIVMQ